MEDDERGFLSQRALFPQQLSQQSQALLLFFDWKKYIIIIVSTHTLGKRFLSRKFLPKTFLQKIETKKKKHDLMKRVHWV